MIKNVCKLRECPECGSENITCNEKKTQLVCRDCGLIYEPLAKAEEEKFERVSGIRKFARRIKGIAGRLRRRAKKIKKK